MRSHALTKAFALALVVGLCSPACEGEPTPTGLPTITPCHGDDVDRSRAAPASLASGDDRLEMQIGTNSWGDHVGDVFGIPSLITPTRVSSRALVLSAAVRFDSMDVAAYRTGAGALEVVRDEDEIRVWRMVSGAQPGVLVSREAGCEVAFELPNAGEWLIVGNGVFPPGMVQCGALVTVGE